MKREVVHCDLRRVRFTARIASLVVAVELIRGLPALEILPPVDEGIRGKLIEVFRAARSESRAPSFLALDIDACPASAQRIL